jgi:hypothetical protein
MAQCVHRNITGESEMMPDVPIQAVVQDQGTALDPKSVGRYADGFMASHTLTRVAATNTIS